MKLRVLLLPAVLVAGWIISRGLRTACYSLRGKITVITGGSRGLGLVLARHICAEGGSVVLIARDPDELARAKADLTRRGGIVLTIQCDLLDSGQIQSAVRQIIDRFGKIDILINSAGIIEVGPLEHMTREDFERTMRLHFWAPYSVSKFALTGFSDAIRAEFARDNIHVTTVAPGMMRTGSHVNAKFKGDHDIEFAWFATAAGAPLISMNADRAARKILAACRRGQPSLTLTMAARGAIVGNALFPNLTGYMMKIINRFLPGAAGEAGGESRAGAHVRRLTPSWLTRLADRATQKNNEAGSQPSSAVKANGRPGC